MIDDPAVLVVHRRSAYTDFVSENGHPHIKRLIQAGNPLVTGLVSAHDHHSASMDKVAEALDRRDINATWRHDIDDLSPDDFDLIVTVGGDGTVLHASHSIERSPVLAVNSSPSSSVGFFTCTDAAHFGACLDMVLTGEQTPVSLSRMEARVNDKMVTDRALNDVLFCHDCPASTTRYILEFKDKKEDQLSSGVWVATAAGSTAAIRAAGGTPLPPRSKQLQFAVREPIPSGGASHRRRQKLIRGLVEEGETFSIHSKTDAAMLYVDGPHVVFSVSFGDVVSFSLSDKPFLLFRNQKKEQ